MRYFQTSHLMRSLLVGLIGLSLSAGFMCPAVSAKVRKPLVKQPARVVTGVELVALAPAAPDAKTIPVSLQISGKGLKATSPTLIKVTLTSMVSGVKSDDGVVTVASDTMIIARVAAPPGEGETILYVVALEIDGQTVNIPNPLKSLEVRKPPQPTVRDIGVNFDPYTNPQSPSQHSLLITPQEDAETFATDPKQMTVQILPPGWTNLNIEQGLSPRKMLVTFTAPDGFEVKDVLVSARDSSGSSMPGPSSSSVSRKKAAEDEVKITQVDILSLQRRSGFGRLKIEGDGFGNYDRPTVDGDLELLCDPQYRTRHAEEREDTNKKDTGKDADDQNAKKDKDEQTPRPLRSLCRDSAGKELVSRDANKSWRDKVGASLNVLLVPRNPDLRVERTVIMYADDKVIDVYFEFSHFEWFSEPFRLSSVSVTVNKPEKTAPPTAPADATGTAESAHAIAARDVVVPPKTRTYLASHDIGPPRDLNLEYRYTVLDQKDASNLFGSGVGEHFYVIQLSLVNKGDKKVIVPLSSIQAEIEWAYGGETDEISYDEGPATLSPLKLSAISSYFDAFQKTKGRKAKLFNILDGVVTLGAALVPVFGHNIERPIAIMSGGFIPGLRKSFGDLSSQQLQNLTSMSWDSVEEIPADGAKEKFIYIQRSDQSYAGTTPPEIRKQIKSIAGLEVSGFVVKDSSPTSATPKQ